MSTTLPWASNAVRSGIVGGHNAGGGDVESNGVQGSNGISIYGLNMVSTGLTEEKSKNALASIQQL